jgi:hypothetical protein
MDTLVVKPFPGSGWYGIFAEQYRGGNRNDRRVEIN